MSELEFNEEKHEYTHKGKNLISVSQLINKYSEDFDSDFIIDKMIGDSPIYLGKKKDYIGMTKDEIETVWNINKEAKSRYGTYIHNGAEYICANPNIDLKELDMLRPEWKQVTKFFKDTGFKAQGTEVKVFNEELGLAGTIDVLLEDSEGKRHIGDWKTNLGKDLADYEGGIYTKMMNYPVNNVPDLPFWHYALQLSFYRYILELDGQDIQSQFLVHLIRSKEDLKDNYNKHVVYPEMNRINYKKIDLPYMKAEVLAILEDYKNENKNE